MIVVTSDSSYHVRGNVKGHLDWTLKIIFARAVKVFLPGILLLVVEPVAHGVHQDLLVGAALLDRSHSVSLGRHKS